MDLYRFYCNRISGSDVLLDAVESHHLANVLRLKKGDKAELFDGKGALATASVETVSGKKVTLRIEQLKTFPRPDQPKVIIATSIAKGQRLDWLIGKCTELGVDVIWPILFERTAKLSRNPKTVQRWQRLAISAAKQSRRLLLPEISKPLSLPMALAKSEQDYTDARLLLGSLEQKSDALIDQSFGDKDVIAFVGPEGGLGDEEQVLLQKAGAEPVRLTDTILRIETAALAFASILTAQRDA